MQFAAAAREKRSKHGTFLRSNVHRPPRRGGRDLDKLIAGFEQTITNGGGTLRSTEKLGRRKLAYTVRKFNDGNYVLLTIDADGKLVAELERRLRVSEPVIKFITVRMDEEQKRIDKIKAIRATRKKVSAQPVAAQPPVDATAPCGNRCACCRSSQLHNVRRTRTRIQD